MFGHFLQQWGLAVDGEPISTESSDLLPVVFQGSPAMLKIARIEEEHRGNQLMVWWNGAGSAPVLAHDGAAILLARAIGDGSLAEVAKSGRDDEATEIACQVAARLHGCSRSLPPHLVDLATWFVDLGAVATAGDPILQIAAKAADRLLGTQVEITVLHGDFHHGNILPFTNGWRAIDPKGLMGERTFDFANMLRNPDFAVASRPGRLVAQATLIARLAKLEYTRLLQWTLALAGLSASWAKMAGEPADEDRAIAHLVASALGGARLSRSCALWVESGP